MNLLILLAVPFMSILATLVVSNAKAVRWIALTGAVCQLFVVGYLYRVFTLASVGADGSNMLFEKQYSLFPSLNISFHVGVDGISIAMILLTSLVVLSGLLVSWSIDKMTKEFFVLLQLLSLGAYGFFISLDLMLLFFFLEVAVIPKFLLIAVWGSGKNAYAANKLALMLMLASAFVLIGMLGLYFSAGPNGTFDIKQLAAMTLSKSLQHIFFPFLFIGFGIFTALFPLHTWVPDGHSSAPTAGSMFLAGISMKLGGYGLLRVATYLMPEGAKEYATIIILLSAIGILYGAFATMMQKDLKYMNAYSSISHCGFVLLGIGMLTKTALTGAVLQMFSHGLMTALFFAVIGMVYQRTHTRIVGEMGGLLKRMPFIMTVLFITGLCSLGLPGFSGFVAEMTVFVGAWEKPFILYRIATIAAAMSIVVTAVYILRAIGQVAMGPLHEGAETLTDATWNEKVAAVVLIVGIVAMGIIPGWLNTMIQPAVGNIMEHLNRI